MSSYHTSFTYLDKNSYDDFNLQIVHFEGGDSGEVDSYLSQDSVYTDSPRGTRRTLYGTRYNSVATLDITIMRPDGSEFSINKTREIYKWLTGATQYNWMDLWVGDEVKYRMYCFVSDIKPYKLDARIVGFTITVESNSPWCYSPLITETLEVNASGVLQIDNPSDDLYTYTQMTTVFENTTGDSLTVSNDTLEEITTVNNLVQNETITLSENMFITSDNTARTFGNDFNYHWPRLKPGINDFTITGTGTITFQYIYPIKVGDCIAGLNASSDPVCDEDGNIILDTLSWDRIINTPNLLSGYGITNAYTKTEVDNKITTTKEYADTEITKAVANKVDQATTLVGYGITDAYTKAEIDIKLKNIILPDGDFDLITLPWDNITDTPTTASGYGLVDVYTKEEVNTLLSSAGVSIDEDELNAMLTEVLV